MDEEELEDIKKKKMEKIKGQIQSEGSEEEAKEEMEAQKKAILRSVMTSEARERLARVRIARPEIAENIEKQIIMLSQRGALNGKIDDETLKKLLGKLTGKKKEINIKRR